MQLTLGHYYHGKSPLHRLDPRVKIIVVILLMVVIFLLNHPLVIGAYGIFLILMIALAKVPFKAVLKSVRAVLFIAIFAFVVNVLTVDTGRLLWSWGPFRLATGGLWNGFKLALRLFYLVVTSSLLLTLTTTPIKIADGLERLLKPLEKLRFPSHELAMMMSIALRFVPTLVEETDKIMKAQSSRGANYDTGNIFQKAKGMVSMLVPLFVSSFKRADDLAIAMEARCYRGGEGRTKLHPLVLRRSDILLFLAALLLIGGLLALEYLLPPLTFVGSI
ncbi:MAG TPA: energy-coupling factor transporter transmembrane protein EcfT [Clostridiaceae bacterium]|nr:energy-coupling factor transporter transmembrane protein EcfT [Clostridiaceae bacterium]